MDMKANRVHRAHARVVAVIALTLAAAATPAVATIYKCQDGNGAPVYQDEPCRTGKELRDFDKDPPTVSVLPLGLPAGTTTRQTLAPAQPAAKIKTGARSKPSLPVGNPSERKFLAPGIHEGEVVTRVGPPDMKSGGSGRKIAR